MNKVDLSWEELHHRACKLGDQLKKDFKTHPLRIYGIPNGGIFAALLVSTQHAFFHLVEDPRKADVYIDDIIDSGATRERYQQLHDIPFYALVDKTNGDDPDTWFSFFWERMQKQDGPQDNVRRLLQYIGEEVDRDGLVDTPDRVVRSFQTLYAGYQMKVEDVITVFEDTSDEMVILKGVEFFSSCEHHMLPFFGKAHIAYIPDGQVIGVSKLARVLEVYSRRLQIQERLCRQVTNALMTHLKPKGAACVLEAQHLCMLSRGVQKQNSVMVTSSLEGAFLKPEVRAEFLQMIRG